METGRKINVLYNFSDCRNRVHDYCNNIVPELLKSLALGFKLTNTYQIYAKDRKRLQAVLDGHNKSSTLSAWSSGYIISDRNNIMMEVSDNYWISRRAYEYYKKTVCIWNISDDKTVEFKTLPLVTHHEIDTACVEIEAAIEEISELHVRLSSLRQLIGKY